MSIHHSYPADLSYRKARLGKLKEPVLITGAAGFIGRRLLNRLLDEGVQVIALDIIACPESLAEEERLQWVQGSVAEYADVLAAVQHAKTIFHLAAMVGDWGRAEQHKLVTVTGTGHIFDAAIAAAQNPVCVLASSIVVYGEQIGQGICHEGLAPGQTFGPYSESKQAQEKLAQRYLQQGMDIRIVRPANVYGAGSKPWVEDLCAELKRGVPALVGGGDFNAGLVHVENVVEVLVRAARGQGLAGQIFNAADEEQVTWKRYMTDMAKLCDAPKPASVPRLLANTLALAMERSYRLLSVSARPPLTREALNLVGSTHQIDMSKTRVVLSYKPCINYEKGLAEVAKYISA